MKHKIIRITDINEINPSNATIYDLNNRYVDAKGNMFGLKYNREERRIQIVRLIRTHNTEAGVLHQQMRIGRLEKSQTYHEDYDANFESSLNESEAEFIDPEKMISETLELMEIHKDRLQGIMLNIDQSNLFNKDNKAERIELEDAFRNIDIECVQQIEKIKDYHRELKNYPRSISYYHAKLNQQGREMIEKLAADKDKTLRYIYYHEMSESIREVYRSLHTHIHRLNEIVENKKSDENSLISAGHNRQAFEDAGVSIHNTIEEVDQTLEKFCKFDEIINRIENL